MTKKGNRCYSEREVCDCHLGHCAACSSSPAGNKPSTKLIMSEPFIIRCNDLQQPHPRNSLHKNTKDLPLKLTDLVLCY